MARPAAGLATEWPADGLETLGACPVCGAVGRELLHEGLEDRIFFAAPGRWTLWRCQGCGSGYLDPRPTAAAIHIAYANYYTHLEPVGSVEPPSLKARLRNVMRSSLLARYAVKRRPVSWLGPLSAWFRPALAGSIDYRCRHLRPPQADGAPKLLDVGCGNGAFLQSATAAGWLAFGCDFDAEAVRVAATSGVDVRLGGPEAFADCKGTFDAVTLSHVIEHVHDPKRFLEDVRALLRPGGQLFIDTPNIDALGYEKYGAAWRGLEPPRHLVLFAWTGLRTLLERCGFDDIVDLPQPQTAEQIWKKSDRVRSGMDPYDQASPYSDDALSGLPRASLIPPARTEFVTLHARRAG